MELPFTIVFEPPSQAELRALLRIRGYWVAGSIVALAIGTAYLLANVAHADAVASEAAVPLALTSQPAGATVWVDGHARGSTPAQVPVEPGAHDVVFKTPDAIDAHYSISVGSTGTDLNAVLWSRQPDVSRLRAALPGASLTDVRVLADGQLALAIALPPGRRAQAWRLDPQTGAISMVADEIWGARLAVAPDGSSLAYIGSDIGPLPSRGADIHGPGEPPADVVWRVHDPSDGSPITGWRPPLESGEQLWDLSWSPHADRLLVFARRSEGADAERTRAWFADVDGLSAQIVLSIPSEVVPGTESWSPDGQHVAFVAHTAQVNALCLLGVDGSFRYVADLEPSRAGPPAYPPFSWSADGQRMLFIAPHQHLPGVAFDWLQPDTARAMYVAAVDQPMPSPLADTPVDAATWREDGQVLGLWRAGSDSPLSIRLLNASSGGSGEGLLDVPLKPSADFGATWDLAHANLLIASRSSAGTEFWLTRLGVEGRQ